MAKEDFTKWTEYDPANVIAPVEHTVSVACGYLLEEGNFAWLQAERPVPDNFEARLRFTWEMWCSTCPSVVGLWAADPGPPTPADIIPAVGLRVYPLTPLELVKLELFSGANTDDVRIGHVYDGGVTIRRQGTKLRVQEDAEVPGFILEVDWPGGTMDYEWVCYMATETMFDCTTLRIGPLDLAERVRRRALLTGGGLGRRGLRTGGRL